MNAPLKHLLIGLSILTTVMAVGVFGYWLAGWRLVEAAYMVVMLVSTVGLEEVHDMSGHPEMQAFTLVLIVFGVSTALYIIGAFVQMMTQGEINRALGLQRVRREIRHLADHVIICGFGRMGEILAEQLHQHKVPLVILDNKTERIAEATQLGYPAVAANAGEEEALLAVGIAKAKTLVTTLPADADNVFITLTARNLNPKIHIIARGEFPSTEKKLLQAGADRVVLPAATGAMRMAAMITRPSIVELVELVAGRRVAEVEVDKLSLAAGCALVGNTLGELHVRSRHGLLIVAVRRSDDQLVFAPGGDMVLQAGDVVMVMGRRADIERFRQQHGV